MDEGLQFGRYRVVSTLSRGRTGLVYLAELGHSRKPVALKALDPSVSGDLVLRERFIRGARAAALVQSPYVAPIFEVGVQMPTGQVWCAMELIEGRSLSDELSALEGEAMSPQVAVYIAKQLCTAIGALHEGGVIHRNIKPANIMLATIGLDRYVVRLVGFGLVKLRELEPGDELTARGAVVGTPAYMAPEALVDSSQVDPTADLYSIGVVLHEMLTGRLPFGSHASRAVIDQLLAKQAGPPHVAIDPAIDDLFATLLAPDRRVRPQSADEVARALSMSSFDDDSPTRQDLSAAPAATPLGEEDFAPEATRPGKL